MKQVCPSSSNPPADAVYSSGLRRLAWLNIALQAAFPLAVAFTPLIAGAEQHFLLRPGPLFSQRTQVYTLGAGETSASVAKKYNLTLGQLRELNQFRTFVHGFDHLQPGDESDVPVAPLPEVCWDATPSTLTGQEQNNEGQAQKVARYASQARILASKTNSGAAVSMTRGMVTGEAVRPITIKINMIGLSVFKYYLYRIVFCFLK